MVIFFFFQAEDGIRILVRSRGLGDVYKGQMLSRPHVYQVVTHTVPRGRSAPPKTRKS